MNLYKIYKNNWYCNKPFETIEKAQQYANSLGDGYNVEYISPYTPISIGERQSMDLVFCNDLINTFVYDNRQVQTTTEQKAALMAKFQNLLLFAQVGDVKTISAELPTIPIDEIYTQARKDKYIQMVNDYLAQF
tara:strand:- start:879 stop:1280 length:402 start_codon:yes stop_codon:yes gene_type:complete